MAGRRLDVQGKAPATAAAEAQAAARGRRADQPIPILVNYTWDVWIAGPHDAESFERSYMRLIDRLSVEGFDALIVWGFLRNSHGGVASARRIASYAREADIRLLPGIGVFCYGGTYFQGDHLYNLETWHRDHPELRGRASDGSDLPLCPSALANQRWMEDSLRWLFEEIPEIGGVHFETGDLGRWLCVCPECQIQTASESGRGGLTGSIADMLRLIPPLAEVVTDCDNAAWNTYSTYSCFWHPSGRLDSRCTDDHRERCVPLERLALLQTMPRYHANWCKGLWDRFELRETDRPPTPEPNWLNTWFVGSLSGGENVGWDWQARWTHRGFLPHVSRVRNACEQIARAGITGFNLEGGYFPDLLDNSLTLAATGYFARKPFASEEEFVGDVLVPDWGAAAQRLWEWVRPYEDWVWAVHSITYHFHAVVRSVVHPGAHDVRASLWPSVDVAAASAANHEALRAARLELDRSPASLTTQLAEAIRRLSEQDLILGAFCRPSGERIISLLTGPTPPEIAALTKALRELRDDLVDLPAFWWSPQS